MKIEIETKYDVGDIVIGYKQKPNEPPLCDNTDVARNRGVDLTD